MLAGRKYLGEETDIWSLGIILYILLAGGLPFDDDDENVMKDLIMKGEYEEPDWLSTGGSIALSVADNLDARSLIRGMLQQDPSQRLTIESILTHPWFKLTLVDKLSEVLGEDGHSLPPTPGVGTPIHYDRNPFFSEPFQRGDPGPSSSRFLNPHSSLPSPLTTQPTTFPEPGQADSEPSETSFDFADSDLGKPDSGVTTPTTAEDEDAEPIKRTHSEEFSHTERVLELLHQNGSQSTLRRSGEESPGSVTGNVKSRVAVKSALEGQTEVDEEAVADEEVSLRDQITSLPDEHSFHLPQAQHSRTPSRTKRRSVSSTLTLERRHSHRSQSGQWQTFPPEDYLAKLNAERDALFSKPSERQLLRQLSDLGFDTGQLVHSVSSDACDASAATWWILLQKQLERGETDEVVEARNASVALKRERATAREERRKARTPSHSSSSKLRAPNVTFQDETTAIPPSVTVVNLGRPLPTSTQLVVPPEDIAVAKVPDAPVVPIIRQTTSIDTRPPHTPPREPKREPISSPTEATSPRSGKSRSPSVSSMLQRATSAFIGTKKTDDSANRSISPTKLTKPPPSAKMAKGESESTLLSVPMSSPSGSINSKSTDKVPPVGPPDATTSEALPSPHDHGKMKASKRDSLWSTFRQLFIEDKRRRKHELPGSPLVASDLKVVPAVVLSRGLGARTPHVNRVAHPVTAAHRLSTDMRPPLVSRRSSSANSRRSSVTSAHFPVDLVEALPPLGRKQSRRSHGSETPNSDREYYDLSRPPSERSVRRGSSRRSSQPMHHSPSMQSDTSGRLQNSPLHNYVRRPTSGSASKRVKHPRAIPAAQILRTGSRASSVCSASSHASSDRREEYSDYDTGREDTSIHSRRRNSSAILITQQNQRARSPLHHAHRHKPKLPLRDVFQKDDEWVSDDDETTAFAGGLGQASTNKPSAAKWAGAAAHPNAVAKHRGRTHRQGQTRSRRGSSDEERDKGTLISEVQNMGGARRAGLPMGDQRGGRAPPIEEEEEEEEE